MKYFSEETKKKMSDSHKGSFHSEKTKEKMRMSHVGKTYPGRHLSEEHKKKLRDIFTGRYVSEETKRKMSISQKGKQHSEETKKKLSEFFRGKPLLEETRIKMREYWTGRKRPNFKGMFKGENNPAWNGGTSFLPYPPEWTEELKQSIKDRDGNSCQNPLCDHKSIILNVHHIDYQKWNCSKFNLITLCHPCNVRANGNRKEWKKCYEKIIWDKYLIQRPKLTLENHLQINEKGERQCQIP